jgi:regulator of protease activity HflC (stomatin/prohibitin superfamily)
VFESVFNFLGERAEEVKPFAVIRSYEMGVRFRWGIADPVALEPGFHWRIPYWQHIETVGVVPEAVELPVQSVLTKDGQSITFSAAITFRVTDAVAHYTAVLDFKESLFAVARMHLAKKVSGWAFAELMEHRTDLEQSLEKTLSTKVKPWGATVDDVGLTNFQRVKAVQLYGAQHLLGP